MHYNFWKLVLYTHNPIVMRIAYHYNCYSIISIISLTLSVVFCKTLVIFKLNPRIAFFLFVKTCGNNGESKEGIIRKCNKNNPLTPFVKGE